MEGKKAQCQIFHHTGSSMQQMNSTFVVCHSGQFWRFFVTHGVGNHVSLGARRGQSIMMHFFLVRQHDAEIQHWLGLCHEIDLYIFLQVRFFWFCSFIIFILYPLFRCKMNKMHNIISYKKKEIYHEESEELYLISYICTIYCTHKLWKRIMKGKNTTNLRQRDICS